MLAGVRGRLLHTYISSRTFGLVEEEKGKIKATSMLCNMFRSLLALSPEDVLPAVYLCTNKIAPDHENMMRDFVDGDRIFQKKPPYYRTAEVPDMWLSPEVVWEIRGADFTVSPLHHTAIGLVHPSRGISVSFPRFIRCLSDRKPEECSTSANTADMFHSQTRKMNVNLEK